MLCHKLERIRIRTVFYAFTVSLVGLLLTFSIWFDTHVEQRHKRLVSKPFLELTNSRKKTIVIIVSPRRSGTSFLGKIISETPGSFYLYEPLLPYGINCSVLGKERIDTLTKILDCDFTNISHDYATAFQVTHYPDSTAKCLRNGLCFCDRSRKLLRDYSAICRYKHSDVPDRLLSSAKYCGYPLKNEHLSDLCRSSSVFGVKVVRTCSLRSLETLYRSLTVKGDRVFIIQLVRDPRAVMSSRLELGLDGFDTASIKAEARALCTRLQEDMRYLNSVTNYQDESETFSDRSYLRLRFEDLISNVQGVSRKIYKFIGRDLPGEVQDAIRKSHFSRKSSHQFSKHKDENVRKNAKLILKRMADPFGTIRDPSEVLQKWRWSLSFSLAKTVQKECVNMMNVMGYKIFVSSKEYLDLSSSYF